MRLSGHLALPRDTPLKKTLFACDELSGFVHACGLVRPSGLDGLEPKSVKKKLKQPSFAAGVNREDVYKGAEGLGVDLDDHIRFVTETSGSNVFCLLKSGTLVTPPLDDQILPGVTRASVIHVELSLSHVLAKTEPLDRTAAKGTLDTLERHMERYFALAGSGADDREIKDRTDIHNTSFSILSAQVDE